MLSTLALVASLAAPSSAYTKPDQKTVLPSGLPAADKPGTDEKRTPEVVAAAMTPDAWRKIAEAVAKTPAPASPKTILGGVGETWREFADYQAPKKSNPAAGLLAATGFTKSADDLQDAHDKTKTFLDGKTEGVNPVDANRSARKAQPERAELVSIVKSALTGEKNEETALRSLSDRLRVFRRQNAKLEPETLGELSQITDRVEGRLAALPLAAGLKAIAATKGPETERARELHRFAKSAATHPRLQPDYQDYFAGVRDAAAPFASSPAPGK